jgi:NTE family protein
MTPKKKKIAIACQGGGTHAAFTWGVLTEILRRTQPGEADGSAADMQLVAISGTSAGAMCALAAWYGLTPNTADSQCGSVDKAIERVDFLWHQFAAATPVEHFHNQAVGEYLRLKGKGVPLPEANPYNGFHQLALSSLAALGARRPYLGFDELLSQLCPHFDAIDWPAVSRSHFRLIVGAIEVLSGNFEVFDSEETLRELGLSSIVEEVDQYSATRWRMRRALTLDGVAASGTLPDVLPAREIEDLRFSSCRPGQTVTRKGYYWDGLYSQNPPVRDLLDVPDRDAKPDEIWVIRINPQEHYPDHPRIRLEDIEDRVGELAGNLSLNQELDHILTVNRWIKKHGSEHPPLQDRKIVRIRTIKMRRETSMRLNQASKFDRSRSHMLRLRDEGREVARAWLADWRSQGDQFAAYPDDARYPVG